MWLKELLSTKSSVSTGRVGFFVSLVMGFLLAVYFFIYGIKNCSEVSVYHFAVLGIFPICGIISYFLAKFYESKMILKFGDKELYIGDDD